MSKSKSVSRDDHARLLGKFILYRTIVHGTLNHILNNNTTIDRSSVGKADFLRIAKTAVVDFTDVTSDIDGRFLEFVEFGFEDARNDILHKIEHGA